MDKYKKYKTQYDSSDLEITIDDEYDYDDDYEDDIECDEECDDYDDYDDDYEDDIECDEECDDNIEIPTNINTINAIKNLLGM